MSAAKKKKKRQENTSQLTSTSKSDAHYCFLFNFRQFHWYKMRPHGPEGPEHTTSLSYNLGSVIPQTIFLQGHFAKVCLAHPNDNIIYAKGFALGMEVFQLLFNRLYGEAKKTSFVAHTACVYKN